MRTQPAGIFLCGFFRIKVRVYHGDRLFLRQDPVSAESLLTPPLFILHGVKGFIVDNPRINVIPKIAPVLQDALYLAVGRPDARHFGGAVTRHTEEIRREQGGKSGSLHFMHLRSAVNDHISERCVFHSLISFPGRRDRIS